MQNELDQFEERARYFSDLMVGWPSVTGTLDEALFAARLRSELATWPVFASPAGHLATVAAPGAFSDRASVLALVRGRGARTVILAGHFDTVPVDDYGDLAPLAGNPEALRERLIARLEASGDNPLALEDLKSGRFLPGRGMLDMKSGIAAGLAVLERFAADPDRAGNLLLLATPDEEENSAGMRSIAAMLPSFLNQHGLEAALTINLDAICDNEDGAAGRVVTMGCIGKLLLSALVVGKEAHACYPLSGVNAAYLAAELVAEMEYAPELGELAGPDLASPPTVLGLKDLKAGYNVTLPARVWTFWNVLLHRRKAGEVLAAGAAIAKRAAGRAAARMRDRAAAMGGGASPTADWDDIPVMTFAELSARAAEASPGHAEAFETRARELAARHELDLPTKSRELVDFTWGQSGLQGPAIVLCIGSMPYPAIGWPEDAGDLEEAIEKAIQETSSAHGVSIERRAFFPAIADMSFMGPVDADDLREVSRNAPLWGSAIEWDLERGATPGIPTINAGPWGRDYHHWLERTHDGYTFRVLPDLVDAIARRVLG
jgi:arginine utilization protein RocB